MTLRMVNTFAVCISGSKRILKRQSQMPLNGGRCIMRNVPSGKIHKTGLDILQGAPEVRAHPKMQQEPDPRRLRRTRKTSKTITLQRLLSKSFMNIDPYPPDMVQIVDKDGKFTPYYLSKTDSKRYPGPSTQWLSNNLKHPAEEYPPARLSNNLKHPARSIRRRGICSRGRIPLRMPGGRYVVFLCHILMGICL